MTSIGITPGDGISVSGSPVTSSGNITVGLSNSTTAKTTQAVYPITFDKNGLITGAGNAVTILQKYTGTITGDNSKTNFTITHGLGSKDVIVQVYEGSSSEDVIVDVTRTTVSAVTIGFASAPASGATYKVVIIG